MTTPAIIGVAITVSKPTNTDHPAAPIIIAEQIEIAHPSCLPERQLEKNLDR